MTDTNVLHTKVGDIDLTPLEEAHDHDSALAAFTGVPYEQYALFVATIVREGIDRASSIFARLDTLLTEREFGGVKAALDGVRDSLDHLARVTLAECVAATGIDPKRGESVEG